MLTIKEELVEDDFLFDKVPRPTEPIHNEMLSGARTSLRGFERADLLDGDKKLIAGIPPIKAEPAYAGILNCVCEVCGSDFFNSEALQMHMRDHFDGWTLLNASDDIVPKHVKVERFSCTMCGESFMSFDELEDHFQVHGGEESQIFEKDSQQDDCALVQAPMDELFDSELKNRTCGRKKKNSIKCKKKKSIKCRTCGRKFAKRSNLNKHIRVHTGEKPYVCKYCGKTFACPSTMKVHIRIHTGEKPYACDICNKRFSQNSSLKRHMTKHTGEKPFPCTQCRASFGTKGSLSNHTKVHSGEKQHPWMKQALGLKNTDVSKLVIRNYSSQAHSDKDGLPDSDGDSIAEQKSGSSVKAIRSGPLNSLICKICGEQFRALSALKKHAKCHMVMKLSQCKNCTKVFKYRSSLKRHMLSCCQLGNPPGTNSGKSSSLALCYSSLATKKISAVSSVCNSSEVKRKCKRENDKHCICKYCKKTFSTKSTLLAHIQIHTGEYTATCKICSKGFTYKSHLDRHMFIHSGDKPFACKICKMRFNQNPTLTSHMKVHAYGKTGCRKMQTASSANMNVSVPSFRLPGGHFEKSKNFLANPAGTSLEAPGIKKLEGKQKKFPCEICGRVLSCKYILAVHTRLHAGKKLFSCQVCGKTFSCKNHLNTHSRIHPGLRLCQMNFTHKSSMKDHVTGHSVDKELKSRTVRGLVQKGSLPKNKLARAKLVKQVTDQTAMTKNSVKSSCKVCGKTFAGKHALHTHMGWHNRGGQHTCLACGKTFKNQSHLYRHKRGHLAALFSCSICNMKFMLNSLLEEHMKSEHRDMIEMEASRLNNTSKSGWDRNDSSCRICHKTFSSAYTLKVHMRLHTRRNLYTCRWCGKEFNYKSHRTTHMRIHTGFKPYRCVTCNMCFTQNSSLKKHMTTRMHHGAFTRSKMEARSGVVIRMDSIGFQMEKQTVSSDNDYASGDAAERSRSRSDTDCMSRGLTAPYGDTNITHSVDFDNCFTCRFCKASFATLFSKTLHEKTHRHSIAKPFACHICKKSFFSKQGLTKHCLFHTGEKPFICKQCGRGFRFRSLLSYHTKQHFTTGKPFKCDFCAMGFMRLANFTRHMITYHYDENFTGTRVNVAGISETSANAEDVKSFGDLKDRTHLKDHSYCKIDEIFL